MSDIVNAIRALRPDVPNPWSMTLRWLLKAADEIERLRAELAEAKREYREGGQILSPCARDSAMSVISGEEWARRFKARIIARLLEPGPSPWTREQAEQIAQDEYEATDCWPALSGHENSPEDAADETLSYWGDGADG